MNILVFKSVPNGWIHQMRARCTFVLLTQKFMQVGWKSLSFQSFTGKLQNAMTWSAVIQCVPTCKMFCVENSYQHLWLFLVVHILSTQLIAKRWNKKPADFTRASHCSSCNQKVRRNIWNCCMIFSIPQRRWTLLNMYVQMRVAKRSVEPKNCWNSILKPHTIHIRQMRPPLKTPSLNIQEVFVAQDITDGQCLIPNMENFLN